MYSPTGQTPGLPDALAAVLHRAGPQPGHAERLNLFGRFIGAWDVEWHGTGHGGRPATMAGELHFGWVLAGSAVQDVWKVPASGQPGHVPAFLRHDTALLQPVLSMTPGGLRRPAPLIGEHTQDVIDELRGASSGKGR
jgi:hypothetical protein